MSSVQEDVMHAVNLDFQHTGSSTVTPPFRLRRSASYPCVIRAPAMTPWPATSKLPFSNAEKGQLTNT